MTRFMLSFYPPWANNSKLINICMHTNQLLTDNKLRKSFLIAEQQVGIISLPTQVLHEEAKVECNSLQIGIYLSKSLRNIQVIQFEPPFIVIIEHFFHVNNLGQYVCLCNMVIQTYIMFTLILCTLYILMNDNFWIISLYFYC